MEHDTLPHQPSGQHTPHFGFPFLSKLFFLFESSILLEVLNIFLVQNLEPAAPFGQLIAAVTYPTPP